MLEALQDRPILLDVNQFTGAQYHCFIFSPYYQMTQQCIIPSFSRQFPGGEPTLKAATLIFFECALAARELSGKTDYSKIYYYNLIIMYGTRDSKVVSL